MGIHCGKDEISATLICVTITSMKAWDTNDVTYTMEVGVFMIGSILEVKVVVVVVVSVVIVVK